MADHTCSLPAEGGILEVGAEGQVSQALSSRVRRPDVRYNHRVDAESHRAEAAEARGCSRTGWREADSPAGSPGSLAVASD